MADQTTRIGLDERRRFVRLAANHRRPLSRDPVWQTTSVVVLDAATVEMMSDRIEPADTLTFGDAERSRVPWLHLPTLVVPAEPVTASTVYTSDHRDDRYPSPRSNRSSGDRRGRRLPACLTLPP